MFESLFKRETLVDKVTAQVISQLKNMNFQDVVKNVNEIPPKLNEVKDTLAHKVDQGVHFDSKAWNLPSSLSIIAIMSFLGFINHCVNNKGMFHNKRIQHIIYGATICIVAAFSFLNHAHHTHLQQICGTFISIVFGALNISSVFSSQQLGQLWNQFRGMKMDNVIRDVKHIADNVKQQVKSKVSEIEDEYKDDTLFSTQSKSQTQLPQQPQQQQQRQQSLQKKQLPQQPVQIDGSKVFRKALFWFKQFIFTCISSLPVVLSNTSHIPRDMPYTTQTRSWLNPMRFFDSFMSLSQPAKQYPVFDVWHTLSFVNMFGIIFCCAMFMLKYPKTKFSKKLQAEMDRIIPGFGSQYFSYFAYSVGICLTTWRFFSVKQWMSMITPITTALCYFMEVFHNHSDAVKQWLQQNKYTKGLPSITNKISAAMADQNHKSRFKDFVQMSRLAMPFVTR